MCIPLELRLQPHNSTNSGGALIMSKKSARKSKNAVPATKRAGVDRRGDAVPNLKRATQLVLELMAIAGKSGQEGRMAEVIEGKLLDAGASASMIRRDNVHRRTPLRGETGNLIFKLPGTFRAPRRMLSAHLDTVPICVGCRPRVEKRMVRSAEPNSGLGADDRAGVATILTTALAILDGDLPHPPLTFCWFVQEEIGLQGSRLVSARNLGHPRMAFNWDGGAPEKLTVGATGGSRIEIEVQGVASHAGLAPERGVSAITVAGLAIADLQRNGWLGLVKRGRREGTSNIGVIRGGHATNVVTDHVTLRAEARSHDGAFRERIVSEMEKSFRRAARSVKNVAGLKGEIRFEPRTDYEAFLLSSDEPAVLTAEAAVKALGRAPVRAVANGGVDANWTNRHGIPTVTLGCGQLNPHMVNEALDLDNFEFACRTALRLATGSELDSHA